MLKMSTRVRYGLRAAVELALRRAWRGAGGGRPVPLSQIVKSQKVPEPYLRQIFFALKQAQLVEAVMGKSGGYRLARDPDRISAYDVVCGLGEAIAPVPCVRTCNGCAHMRTCPTHPLWRQLTEMLEKTMTLTTIGHLAKRCPVRGRRRRHQGTMFGI
jgi:Rrf2 family protein